MDIEAQEIRTSNGHCGYSIGDKHFITTHQSINGCTVYVESDTESEARRQAINLKSFFAEHLG
jgi:hypothetical protein